MRENALRNSTVIPAPQAPDHGGHLGEMVTRLDRLLNLVADVSRRVETIGDSIYGQRPGGTEQPTPAAVPNGVLAAIEQRIAWLEEAANTLSSHTSRLSEIA